MSMLDNVDDEPIAVSAAPALPAKFNPTVYKKFRAVMRKVCFLKQYL
jgi:hypothetical protein